MIDRYPIIFCHPQEIVTTQECMVADIEDYYLDKRGSAELQKYQESQNKIQGNFLPEFVSTAMIL